MQLSEQTIEVLKNFANVNPNLVVSAGSNLKTISEAKNIMASANVVAIYDLNEFLSALNLIDSPTLEFTDNAVKIKNDSSSVEYRFANIEILTQPAKSVTMPDVDVSLKISADDISQIKRAAAALGHPVLSLSVVDNSVVAKVCDPNNPTANTWSKIIPTDRIDDWADFDYQFLISNLKLLPGDYEVQISSKLITQFKNKEVNVTYWIALEKLSTFGV